MMMKLGLQKQLRLTKPSQRTIFNFLKSSSATQKDESAQTGKENEAAES